MNRPDAVLDEVQRAVEEPAEVVDETVCLVDEHEATAGLVQAGRKKSSSGIHFRICFNHVSIIDAHFSACSRMIM